MSRKKDIYDIQTLLVEMLIIEQDEEHDYWTIAERILDMIKPRKNASS